MKIAYFGNAYITKILNNLKNPFWKDIMLSLQQFSRDFEIEHQNEVDACSFLYNENITVGNETIKKKYLSIIIYSISINLKMGTHFSHTKSS